MARGRERGDGVDRRFRGDRNDNEFRFARMREFRRATPLSISSRAVRLALESAHALVHPSAEDWTAAWEAHNRGDGAQAGIVDQFSFVVMRREGITHAFTNDKHFAAAGFELLF